MITTYFGSPGCGKTTLAVKMALKNQKQYDYTFLNFDHLINNSSVCNLDGLGSGLFLTIVLFALTKLE